MKTKYICVNCGKVEESKKDLGFEIIEERCEECKNESNTM